MSRIDELIAEHCPDGVPYLPMGEVGEFIRGNGLSKSDLRDSGTPAIHYGQIHTFYGVWADKTKSFAEPALAAKLRRAKPGDLVIATTSEDDGAVAKATAWIGDEEVAVSGDAYIYRHTLDPLYVAYFFQSEQFQSQKTRHITGTKVRRLSGESLSKILIPVPPLQIQVEIAQILDRFTRLAAELAAELATRREQYEFYRDSLLSFNDAGTPPWRWVAMGEIAEVRSGWGFPLSEQGLTTGDVPFYKVSDMNLLGNEVIMTQANHYISVNSVNRLGIKPAPAGTIVFPKIGAAVATNKKRVLSVESAYDNNVMGLIPGPQVMSRYLYHWMQTFNLSELANDSGAMPSIRKSEAEEL